MKIALGFLGIILVVVLVIALLSQPYMLMQNNLGPQTPATDERLLSSVATAALALQDHLTGIFANDYNAQDPFMEHVMTYWSRACKNTDGSMCNYARSGQLQCVEFVTAAYWLAGDELPAIYDAEYFWQPYHTLSGWEAIDSPSANPQAPFRAPYLGDLMVWKGGAHIEHLPDGSTRWREVGHIAIVVGYRPPVGSNNGSITVAQGNGEGNRFTGVNQTNTGNTYTMTVHPDGHIDTWGPFTYQDGTHYGGYVVLGFLHHQRTLPSLPLLSVSSTSFASTLPAGYSLTQPLVLEAWNDAKAANIPPGYFVRQIAQESGFQPTARSPVGAIGIAQFMPGTAASLGIDPTNPHQALNGAAHLMSTYTQQYQGDYAKALAAYNAGSAHVTNAERMAANTGNPSSWMNFLYAETRNYIHVIMNV